MPPSVTNLTPDDTRILRECNNESFYKRCLPLIIAGTALTHTWFGRMAEPMSQGKRIGGYTAVTVIAWIIGKMSYRRTCEDKILTSGYNSRLVDAIRKRRGLPEPEFASDYSSDEPLAFDWKEDDRQSAMKDEWNRSLSRNTDGPTGDKPFYGDDDMTIEGRKEYTSYDDLRQQNRSRVAPAVHPDPRSRSQQLEDRRF